MRAQAHLPVHTAPSLSRAYYFCGLDVVVNSLHLDFYSTSLKSLRVFTSGAYFLHNGR